MKIKISLSEDNLSSDTERWVLAIEFPDEDLKAYVKSDSVLFPNSLLEFESEQSASVYAQQHFPGMNFFVEKR